MKFEKLKPGMVVYDVHSHGMGNTTMRTLGVWDVRIISVDPVSRSCLASWNGNPAGQHFEYAIKKWKERRPYLVRTAMGNYRRPTREELAAHRASLRATGATTKESEQ